MSIDMRQFQQTFFAESAEGLDVMESGLLALQPAALDSETINAIFRAAHSIKGGAGTFGFEAIGEFTHVVETLLDELRSGTRVADAALIDLLLQSVDVLRALFDDAQAGRPINLTAHQGTQQALARALQTPGAEPPVTAEAGAAGRAPGGGWRIDFRPHPELFATGNDPLHVLRELASLGSLHAQVQADASLDPASMDPTQCYLRWDLELITEADEPAVREAFAWIEDECDLAITALAVAEPQVMAAEPQAAAVGTAPAPAGQTSIRVSVDKIDALINLVGELVITQSMLHQAGQALDTAQHEQLVAGLELLARNTRDIQEAVMSTRMVAIDSVFKRFPRVLRDVAGRLGKQVELQTEGEGTELDRGVTEKIVDPLTHIIRNSVDHGIESPADRLAAGKPEAGQITLRAAHEGGYIVIEVLDDGAGLDRERILAKAAASGLPVSDDMADADVWQLLFAPGFSTAAAVTDLSGRGVGMDVVKRNIVSLGGQVTLSSRAGQGTRVEIRLPLTLAILDGMLVGVGDEIYVIPLNFVSQSLCPVQDDIRSIAGTSQVVRVRDQYIPILSLRQLFAVDGATPALTDSVLVVTEADGRRVALQVDALLGHQQVVIKNLEEHYRHVFGVSGATILGDGRVSLILDAAELSSLQVQDQAA